MIDKVGNLRFIFLVIIITFTTGLTVSAAEPGSTLSILKVLKDGKAITAVTLYANVEENLAEQVVPQEYLTYNGTFSAQKTVTYDVVAFVDKAETIQGRFQCATNNRAVAVAQVESNTITITAIGNGKAKITLSDLANKKKIVINVTVKSIVNTLTFSRAPENQVNIGVKGKYDLGAVVNASAIDKKLKYTVITPTGQSTNIIKVDKNGKVMAGTVTGTAVIQVESQDLQYIYKDGKTTKKYICGSQKQLIQVTVSPKKVDQVTFYSPTVNAKGGYDKISMRTNGGSSLHTYQLAYTAFLSGRRVDGSTVSFSSSKESVATVDSKGKIIAVGNGTAVISAIPADGTALNKKVVITVEVKTDISKINLPKDEIELAVGKTYKVGATVDKNVNGSKALLYDATTLVCQNTEGQIVTDDKAVISLDKTGKITAKNPGTAIFTICSADFPNIKRKVYVTVYNPIATLTAKVPVSSRPEDGTQASTKLYLASEQVDEKFDETTIVIDKVGKDQTLSCSEALTFTSSNTKVVRVDHNGTIKAVGNGKAKITVKASVSGKSASINVEVVQKVTEVKVAGIPAVYSPGTHEQPGYDYEIYLPAGREKVLSASVNSNANNKALTYGIWYKDGESMESTGISFDSKTKKIRAGTGAEGEAYVVISAGDGTANPKQDPAGTVIHVVAVGNDTYISSKDILKSSLTTLEDRQNSTGKLLTLKKGEAFDTGFILPAYITKRDVIWATDKAGVVTVKDGILIAKGTGTANITVTAKDAAAAAEKTVYTFPVYVEGKSDGEFQKEFSNKVKTAVNGEDYTHLGIKPAFTEKTVNRNGQMVKLPSINMKILEPSALVYDGREGAFRAVWDTIIRNVLDNGYNSVLISTGLEETWDVSRDETGIAVRNSNTGDSVACRSLEEAIDTLSSLLSISSPELVDWNGKIFYTSFRKEVPAADNRHEAAAYVVTCEMNFTMDQGLLDQKIDERIQNSLKQLNQADGIGSITYDAVQNTVMVDIREGNTPTQDFIDSISPDIGEVLSSVYKEVSGAVIYSADAKVGYSRGDTGLSGQLLEVLAPEENNLLHDLDGKVIRIEAVYDFAGTSITLAHSIVFERGLKSISAEVNEQIADTISHLNSDITSLSFESSLHKLVVRTGNTYQKGSQDDNIIRVMETLLSSGGIKAATVKTDRGDTTSWELPGHLPTRAQLAESLQPSYKNKLRREMFGKGVCIEAVYDDCSAQVLTYHIEFMPDMDTIDSMVDEAVEKYRKSMGINQYLDRSLIGYEADINVLDIAFTSAAKEKDLWSLEGAGVKTLIMSLLGVSGVAEPEKVIFRHNGSSRSIDTGKIPTDMELYLAINPLFGSDKIKNIAGQTLEIEVVYSKVFSIGTLKYQLKFLPLPLEVLKSDQEMQGMEVPEVPEDMEVPETSEKNENAGASEDMEIPKIVQPQEED